MSPTEQQIEELLEKAYLSWEETGSLTQDDFIRAVICTKSLSL